MVKVAVAAVSEVADAVIVIDPARTALTVSVTTPPATVAEPSPLTVPAPALLAKVTLVVLSLVTRLPPASRTSTVSARVVPEIRLPVELVNVRWSAAPTVTLNVAVSEVMDAALAVTVIEQARAPVTLVDATPPDATPEPRPVTVPAPAVFANVILVVLSVFSTFPNASRTSTVKFREAPDARLPVELVKVRWSAGAGLTVNELESTAIVLVPPLVLISAL